MSSLVCCEAEPGSGVIVGATDGSRSNFKQEFGIPHGTGTLGWAWLCDTSGSRRSNGSPVLASNLRAELAALVSFLEAHPRGDLLIRADCKYVIDGVASLPRWKKRNWITTADKPVANQDLFRHVDLLLRSREGSVEFEWIKGHSGDRMNESVDKMAASWSSYYKKRVQRMKREEAESLPHDKDYAVVVYASVFDAIDDIAFVMESEFDDEDRPMSCINRFLNEDRFEIAPDLEPPTEDESARILKLVRERVTTFDDTEIVSICANTVKQVRELSIDRDIMKHLTGGKVFVTSAMIAEMQGLIEFDLASVTDTMPVAMIVPMK